MTCRREDGWEEDEHREAEDLNKVLQDKVHLERLFCHPLHVVSR